MSFGLSAAKALEEGKLAVSGQRHGLRVALRRGVGTWFSMCGVATARRPPGTIRFCAGRNRSKNKESPDSCAAAIRAVMRAHKALKEDLSLATAVGKKRFPPSEAELIAELVRRDLPYYDPIIAPDTVTHMNSFAQDIGLLTTSVPYSQVVATQFSPLWTQKL